MKRIFTLAFAIIIIAGFSAKTTNSQTGYNSVLEYSTGTWCGWCMCAEIIIDSIKQSYPRTMVLGYHGPAGLDPWGSTSVPMIGLLGLTGYPLGVINRITGVMDRSGWVYTVANYDTLLQPGCDIAVNNYNYNASTHTITANVVSTARFNLSGTFYIMMVLTENNVVAQQSGAGNCPGNPAYVHKNIVQGLINGSEGTLLPAVGTWTGGTSLTTPLNYTLPQGVVDANCNLNIFIYTGGVNFSTDCLVQQSTIVPVATGPTGISGQNSNAPAQFRLSQNYPNPFNPTTNIHFTLPKDGEASLKVYDILGNEVAVYSDGFMKSGTYNAEVDASSWASGIYFYRLRAGNFIETKKMTLIK